MAVSFSVKGVTVIGKDGILVRAVVDNVAEDSVMLTSCIDLSSDTLVEDVSRNFLH
jgi:hypothetical protein